MGLVKRGGVNDPAAPQAGRDLLRELAGEPARVVHVGRHDIHFRVVDIHRDASGRIIGSTEHIEDVQFLDATGDWLQ
jgi:hypothetical protein